jgi:hypothetical protein
MADDGWNLIGRRGYAWQTCGLRGLTQASAVSCM